ncbi:membrane protein [Mycobacterium phage Willsammy]|uniref:Membrane protein n=1 Tax=Mycobacterium phage Willsammy TaxID=2713268 RepID=A0A6G8R222_9CAUD|nr:membrane protein [Mycobacterium phage Willsammy]QIN94249.1 membrane protein [Mycobacterium phage Willsammy]
MMDRYTVFGIEKPFPWVGVALGIGLLGGLMLTGLLSWAFAVGSVALVEKLIDDRPDF